MQLNKRRGINLLKVVEASRAETLQAMIDTGYDLAMENGSPDPTLHDAVWELMVEAADTSRRLPDRERGWLLSCERCAWPETVRTIVEEFAKAVSRGGIWEAMTVHRGPPSAAAIDRMDEVLGWLNAVESKNRKRDLKVLYALSAGVPVRKVRALYGGLGRQTVYDIRARGLSFICLWLRDEFDIR